MHCLVLCVIRIPPIPSLHRADISSTNAQSPLASKPPQNMLWISIDIFLFPLALHAFKG